MRQVVLNILIAFSILVFTNVCLGQSQLLNLPQMTTISKISNNVNLKSTLGQEIFVYKFSAIDQNGKKTKSKYSFLVQGGIHGNELLTPRFVRWLTKRYSRGSSPLNSLPRELVSIDFIPVANPDGIRSIDRYNSKGVNLNRNFGVLWGTSAENPGKSKFSESETKSLKFLFEKRKYTSAVDVHGYTNWIVAPTSPEKLAHMGGTPNPKFASYYAAWIRAIRTEMKLLPGYALKTAGGLGDGGAFEDWAFWSQNTLSYCLELKSKSRFASNYRRPFADIQNQGSGVQIDLFKRYEMYVFKMFEHAIKIKSRVPGTVADTSPLGGSETKGTH